MPRSHSVLLHDGIRVLARNARIDQGKQDLRREDEATRLVEVGHHAVRIELQAVNHANEALEHVVERDEAIGLGHALSGGVRDVALVPKGDVVKGNLCVCFHHARKAADLLHGDGVALVRHGGAALLTLAERLLGLERIGLLQIANLGSDALAGGCGGGKNTGEIRMVVTGDNLRGQRIVNQTQVLADVLLDKRVDGAVGSHRAGNGAKGHVLTSIL